MNEHDLELYRRIISEKEARVSALEVALRSVTYVNGSQVHVAYREHVDLADKDPIFHEVHSMI